VHRAKRVLGRGFALKPWDFLTQYTAIFALVHIFVIMEIGSRRIVHVNVTPSPTLSWVKQQIREATADDQTPRFLVHDNDGIFGQYGKPVTMERDDRTRSCRCHLDPWSAKTPYGPAQRGGTPFRRGTSLAVLRSLAMRTLIVTGM
jgi:hypothetical protein